MDKFNDKLCYSEDSDFTSIQMFNIVILSIASILCIITNIST